MLDHISQGRFEFGTGRGAGSHEILGFLPGMTDLSQTREIWEDVIAEFPKMWMQDTYEGYEGKYWSLPPRKVLPKPWKKPHPPMWYAAGNPSSYEMAAHKGLGVLGLLGRRPQRHGDDRRRLQGRDQGRRADRRVRQRQHLRDDGGVREGRRTKRQCSRRSTSRLNDLQSHVFRYHDTFPHPEAVPYWPELIPDVRRRDHRGDDRHRRGDLRRSRRGARAVQALGVGRLRPAGLRDRARRRSTTRSR